MLPRYQNWSLGGDVRAQRRVVKFLEKQFGDEEQMVMFGTDDYSAEASIQHNTLEKKLLLFIALCLEAQADIEQEADRPNDNGGGGGAGGSPGGGPGPGGGQDEDENFNYFDDNNNLPPSNPSTRQLSPFRDRSRNRRHSSPPAMRPPSEYVPSSTVIGPIVDAKPTEKRGKKSKKDTTFSTPKVVESGKRSSTRLKKLTEGDLHGGSIKYSGQFAGILKNMVGVLNDCVQLLRQMVDTFSFLNKHQVENLSQLLNRSLNTFNHLSNIFYTHVQDFDFNKQSKIQLLNEVDSVLSQVYNQARNFIDNYVPALVRISTPSSDQNDKGYSAMPRRYK